MLTIVAAGCVCLAIVADIRATRAARRALLVVYGRVL